jgi:TrbL/VirB6 plasmid conjugal transfer protein
MDQHHAEGGSLMNSPSFLRYRTSHTDRRSRDSLRMLVQAISKRFFVMVCVTLLALVIPVVSVNAQPAPAASASDPYDQGKTANGAEILKMAADAIETRLKDMRNSPQLKTIGLTLVGFFVIANVMFFLLKNFATGTGLNGVIADMMGLAILAGVTQIFLDRDIGDAIIKTIDVVAGAVTGLGSSGSTVSELMLEAGRDTFETLKNMWDVGNMVKLDFSLLNLGKSLSLLLIILLKLIALGVTTFLLLVALGIYFATLVMSQVTVVIALILAPIFVPFLLFSPASFMFDGWLRFTIGAGFMKVIGALMVKITGIIMATLAGVSTQAVARAGGAQYSLDAFSVDIVLYCVMILLGALCAYLMMKGPEIATGLISGSGGAGGFKGWHEIASKSIATRGVMGGMQVGRGVGGGGAGGASGQPTHSMSGVQRAMPNVLKPAANLAGQAASAAGGWLAAGRHHAQGEKAPDRNVAFDIRGNMSATSERAYRTRFEGLNRDAMAKGGRPVTVSKPKLTMDGSDKK